MGEPCKERFAALPQVHSKNSTLKTDAEVKSAILKNSVTKTYYGVDDAKAELPDETQKK